MEEIKKYLKVSDYVRFVLITPIVWFTITVFFAFLTNENSALSLILSTTTTPIIMYWVLYAKAKSVKKEYMMIWKAKEDFDNSKEQEELNEM